jgi:hypothetical protein
MSRPWQALTLALAALALAPLAAVPQAPADDPAGPGDLRAEWRRKVALNPRLLDDARAFLRLPAADQERMRKLDRDLRALDSSSQARLGKVLERYADWLDRLPEEQRRQVVMAPTKHARLKVIRELREAQWLSRQPRRVRVWLTAQRPTAADALRAAQAILPAQAGPGLALTAAPLSLPEGEARAAVIARLRQEEGKRRREWQIALRLWDDLREGTRKLPTRITDLDGPVQTYAKEYLRPMLRAGEWERLEKAQGQWPLFPQTLVELADRHPPALQGAHGPTSLKELPGDLRRRLDWHLNALGGKGDFKGGKGGFKGPKGGAEFFWRSYLNKAEGRWPGFALAVTDFAARHGMAMPNELWPLRKRDLSPAVRQFLEDKLLPRLDNEEKKLLREKEGKWPEYPHTIQELAQRHYLKVPWQTLPGRSEDWDAYRSRPRSAVEGFPELPPHRLREFVLHELSPQDRAALNVSWSDPSCWQRVTEEYFKRRPGEQKRLRLHDLQHHLRRPGGPHGGSAFLGAPPAPRSGPMRRP